jgi:hypothetical protein
MSTRSKARYSAKGRQRSQKRSQKGGEGAAEWQLNNLGNGWTQFMNTFSLQPGQNNSANQSNNIVQNHPKMTGGAKRSNMMQMRQRQMLQAKSRGKKGGFFGPVLEQAAVPLALLGAQHFYGKRHTRRNNGSKKSFKRRR